MTSKILWLGGNCPLLEAAWSLTDVYHVRTAHSLLTALQHQIAPCVLLDMAFTEHNLIELSEQIRNRWPGITILALAAQPNDSLGADLYINPGIAAAEFEKILQRLPSKSTTQPKPPTRSPADYAELEDRLRHLEGLLQATLTFSRITETDTILGDIRKTARSSVHADEVSVLLTDAQCTGLFDTLKLNTPPSYLQFMNDQYRKLDLGGRLNYLGAELLLRTPATDTGEMVGYQSYMRLPLVVEQQLVGFVSLFSKTSGLFDGAHLQLGRLFATQVAAAVRNVNLYFRLNRAEQRQQTINRIAQWISEDLTLDSVLTRVVEEAVQLMGGQRGLVLLTQPDGSLVVRAVSNYPESLVNHRVPAGAGQAGMIAATGKAHAAQNYPEMANLISDLHGDFPSDGVLYGVPLSYRGQVRGVLQVVSSGLSSEEVNDRLSVLMMLAPQVATAIVKAQLHDTISEDREQLRAILEHAGVAVAVWDTSGKIHLVNPEAQRLLNVLGYSPDLFKEKPPRHVIETLLPLNMTLEDLGSVIEINLGEVGQYLLHIAPIALPGSTRYVGVAQEVSELRRLDRMKSDLIQILSHDLRNPLGLARGAVDLMVDPSTPIENRPQLVEMMVSSMERMELLISDVVDLDMAEDMGTETAMPYTLSLVVNRVIRQNKPKAERHSLTLSYHEEQAPGHHMFGHGILVGQMVDNLVNNAIKYTPAGGTIDVMLNVEGDNAVIRVKDTGFGISAEHLPHIFDQFYRVRDDRTRSVEGTGLGLHLVRKIAQAHGGRVTVESAVGVGSTFTILLPLYLTPETQPITTIKRVDLSNYVKRDA